MSVRVVTARTRRLLVVSLEFSAIFAVVAVLVTLEQFLPARFEPALVYQIGAADVNPFTYITASYLHVDQQHLSGNAIAYLAGAGLCYVLCLAVDERQWYWLTFLSLLLVVPFLTAWANMNVYVDLLPNVPVRGFSDIASAFIGFLCVALVVFVRALHSRLTTIYVGVLVFGVVVTELLAMYAQPLPTEVLFLALVVLFVGIGWNGWRSVRSDSFNLRISVGSAVVVLVLLAVIFLIVQAMFPANVTTNGTFTNVYAHGTGFGLGVVIAAWGHRYWATMEW